MSKLAQLDRISAARQAAGNWQRFESFVWYRDRELDHSECWGVFYTHHRDSCLLAQSNAAVMRQALKPYAQRTNPDVVFETHSHWVVGELHGFSQRVFRQLRITPAFRTYHSLLIQQDEYPIFDEADYAARELEATLSNLESAAWLLKRQYRLPGDWPDTVHAWLADHRPQALENHDDQGGWPEEADLMAAFYALGYPSREARTQATNP